MILVSGGGNTSWPWVFCCCIFVSAVLHQWRDEITGAALRLPLASCRLPSSALPLPRSAGSATCLVQCVLISVAITAGTSCRHANLRQERPVSIPTHLNLIWRKRYLAYILPSSLPAILPTDVGHCLGVTNRYHSLSIAVCCRKSMSNRSPPSYSSSLRLESLSRDLTEVFRGFSQSHKTNAKTRQHCFRIALGKPIISSGGCRGFPHSLHVNILITHQIM
jgi:hypothetical protein